MSSKVFHLENHMKVDGRQLPDKFKRMKQAYIQLAEGSHTLLQLNTVYWTEALLLKVVRALYRRRLQQISSVLEQFPDESNG